MSTFQVPFSSSPPTTPQSKKSQLPRGSLTNPDMAENPSTTPAGPPPNTGASFTPAGPPPSTVFGSSQFGTNVSKLNFTKQNLQPESRRLATFQPARARNGTPGQVLGRHDSGLPSSSILSEGDSFDRGESEVPDYEDGDEYRDGYDESMQMGESAGNYNRAGMPALTGFTAINLKDARSTLRSSLLESQSNPHKRSKLQQSTRSKRGAVTSHQLPRKGQADIIPNLARDMASRSQPASLTEADDMILQTEDIMVQLHQQLENVRDDGIRRGTLAARSLDLMRLWNSRAPPGQNFGEGIGPGPDASALQNAAYLSSLLLALRHPPFLTTSSASSGRVTMSKALTLPAQPMPIPKILVDWLNRYHLSYDDLLEAVRATSPNCTANDQFWDLAFGMLVRGQVSHVIQLFSEADFQHAASTLDDGEDERGYHGVQLQAVQSAVYRALELLATCPATKGDWQINSSDWDIFRNRTSSELEHLASTGGTEQEEDDASDLFKAENFGLQKTGRLIPRPARSARRQLPWSIYQKMKVFYGILLGSADEIVAQSQDWLEATAALTIWWDGTEESNITTWSMNVSRAQRAQTSERRDDPYLSRLSAALLCVTDPDYEESFQINSLSTLEVGLASILQGNIEGVLGSLRTYSMVIASGVAEIGSLAGWLEQAQTDHAAGLDQEDLMVLSYGFPSHGITKDSLLLHYSKQLFERSEFVNNSDAREGWELAISVSSRVADRDLATETISKFLGQLHLDSQDRLDKLLTLCASLGLDTEARKVSERFADHLSTSTTLYGQALLCYARSHAPTKIRQLIDLLVSTSLIQSAAFPTTDNLDDDLRILVENPKRPLSKLQQIDPDAAEMLQFYLAGYACLRRFYNLRDEALTAKAAGRTPHQKPFARKKQAAKALIAVLNSAADCIYGGLYDAERASAIQVDGLLVLLGEVSALVGQDQQVLTAPQMYDVLAAIEDLQTVSKRVYQVAEECFQATMRSFLNETGDGDGNGNGEEEQDPANRLRAMFQKSLSAGTASSGGFSFEELAASDFAGMKGSGTGDGKSIGGSGVLVPGNVKVERGWDWRRRKFANAKRGEGGGGGADQVRAEDVLGFLRRSIAVELSIAELDDA